MIPLLGGIPPLTGRKQAKIRVSENRASGNRVMRGLGVYVGPQLSNYINYLDFCCPQLEIE